MKAITIKTFLLVSFCLFGFASAKINETSIDKNCQSQPKDILNLEWVDNGVPEGGWYFPLFSKNTRSKFYANAGSELAHLNFYEKQQNRPFCPRLSWTDGVGTLIYHEKKFVFHCIENIDNSTMPCTLWERQVVDQDTKPDRVKLIFALTDNQRYIFIFRCWEDGYNDWQVISSEKTLSKEVKETVLNEAELVGFDRESYYEIGYEKCY